MRCILKGVEGGIMRVNIMDVTCGDIVKTFDNWDEAMEWIESNQECFRYEPIEEG